VAAAGAVHVDSSNDEQLQAWDGDEGAYWADHADYFDRSAIPIHKCLMATAAVTVSDRVLDFGCGTGQTTRDAACAATAGFALGVDLSSRMIEYARCRAVDEGIENVSFEQADAQIHPFAPQAFDVAISRSSAMFFGDLVAAFTNIGRALQPGGRLVMTTWQPLAENEWIREITGALAAGRVLPAPPPNARGPFALSDPDRVRAVLTSAGFTDVELDGVRPGLWFGTDGNDAYEFVLGLMGWMLEGLDDSGRRRALEGLRATTTAHETSDGVIFQSAAWTVRARRR
jgi:SAM-dependent methyltransferase